MLIMIRFLLRQFIGRSEIQKKLGKHFNSIALGELVTSGKDFPVTSRVDVQAALQEAFAETVNPGAALLGIHSQIGHETVTLAHVFTGGGPFGIDFGPLQHDNIDTGDPVPARCLKNGLWLARQKNVPYAVLLSPSLAYGQMAGVHVEVAVPQGEAGAALSHEFFRQLELKVGAGKTYRGRVISLEGAGQCGPGGSVKVHRLHQVRREEVILPETTLKLLDRNVTGFVARREQIKNWRFSAKKGLLFYGPPGTGKTHTIHYLASQLPDHTTLLVTGEQVALIGEYFRLARFLQPALMVIEDVDLIARERENMRVPGEELLLNKLLNEMDGLREDADILFILTTNRPAALEPALAARPGRIDQAIEFPLPDEAGRAKLVRLYSGGLEISDSLLSLLVRRTAGVSAAFIKELMRRSAQFQIESTAAAPSLEQPAVDAAIEEMVFLGGSLNLTLLGGTGTELAVRNAVVTAVEGR
jgi:hypothetical protein